MSRGPGKLQRVLFLTIKRHGKPMTFDDIRAAAMDDGGFLLAVSFERSASLCDPKKLCMCPAPNAALHRSGQSSTLIISL
jgi:hypothetical protein